MSSDPFAHRLNAQLGVVYIDPATVVIVASIAYYLQANLCAFSVASQLRAHVPVTVT